MEEDKLKNNREGHRKRLQERYLSCGYKSLADYEIIEFLLFPIIPRRDTKALAKELLEKFSTIEGIFEADPKELKKVKGLGDVSTTYLKFIGDLFSYYYEDKVLNDKENNRISIRSKNQLLNYLRKNIGISKIEEFKVIFLNSNNEVLGVETLFQGTIDKSAVYPRKILERVMFYNARSIIFAHNHPSGNTNPSSKDIEITKMMKEFFKMVDVSVLDHIIISRDSYFSFLEEGII
ncbi:DNA repair protein RadC [Fusobacterium sp.]|uniref:RadC family protein n=1 Tax=Fusobacterium sp. TaxID=68766 RepID=UPI002626D246|nr:DNA repair protein RadC [Fusobacterium sp.]